MKHRGRVTSSLCKFKTSFRVLSKWYSNEQISRNEVSGSPPYLCHYSRGHFALNRDHKPLNDEPLSLIAKMEGQLLSYCRIVAIKN